MSRAPAADVIEVRPTSNVYTVLVVVALLAELAAFAALYYRAADIFLEGKNLFS